MTTLTTEYVAKYRPLFHFNELLAIIDDAGKDTGVRCRYVGVQANYLGEPTDCAHVCIVGAGGVNRAIKWSHLAPVKQ